MIDLHPDAVTTCTRWAQRRCGAEWEDAVHDGILRLLEQQHSRLAQSCPGQIHLMRAGMVDAWRARTDTGRVTLVPLDPAVPAPPVPFHVHDDLKHCLAQQSARTQRILIRWAMGWRVKELAAAEGLTSGRISQLLHQEAPTWRDYHLFEAAPKTPSMLEAARRMGQQYGRSNRLAQAARQRARRAEMIS